MRSVAALSIVLASILSLTACKPDPHGALRAITVDADSRAGAYRSLQGVNGAPGAGFHKPIDFLFGGWNMPANIDVSEGYRRARIDLVRTHDAYGPGDIDPHFGAAHCLRPSIVSPERDVLGIFPNPEADPSDPDSYHFGPTDQLIASIQNIGAEVMFRIGRSECSHVDPPKDFDRYAAIVEHIVLHYNQGWAHGFHYKIRYWEVWNEPDLGKLFWGGTPEQFYALYGKIAQAVKQADPNALVGGPAIARPNDNSPYREPFLQYVRDQKLPLDFYSWHWYASDSNDPLDVVRIAHDIRLRLDSMGFGRTQSVVNEWNYGLGDPLPADLERASFLASALAYMQDAPVDLSAIYRADNLFGRDGATPNKVGQALIASGRMKDTPVRLRTTGSDHDGFAVQAGRSLDGRTIQVLVSNYEIPKALIGPRSRPDILSVPNVFEVRLLKRRQVSYRDNGGYDITIDNLAANQRYSIERYRISSERNFQLLDRTVQRGPLVRLQARLPPPGIELISIKSTRN